MVVILFLHATRVTSHCTIPTYICQVAADLSRCFSSLSHFQLEVEFRKDFDVAGSIVQHWHAITSSDDGAVVAFH